MVQALVSTFRLLGSLKGWFFSLKGVDVVWIIEIDGFLWVVVVFVYFGCLAILIRDGENLFGLVRKNFMRFFVNVISIWHG